MQSKARPALSSAERKELIKHEFLEVYTDKSRGRGGYMRLKDSAWGWAARTADVTFPKSADAAGALQGLVRRLIPFLQENDLVLASLFLGQSANKEPRRNTERAWPPPEPVPIDPQHLWSKIESACLELTGGRRQERVRLAALRARLLELPRPVLDTALVTLQRQDKLVLYREDNTAALTAEDHQAALLVGDSPRHLVILENK